MFVSMAPKNIVMATMDNIVYSLFLSCCYNEIQLKIRLTNSCPQGGHRLTNRDLIVNQNCLFHKLLIHLFYVHGVVDGVSKVHLAKPACLLIMLKILFGSLEFRRQKRQNMDFLKTSCRLCQKSNIFGELFIPLSQFQSFLGTFTFYRYRKYKNKHKYIKW